MVTLKSIIEFNGGTIIAKTISCGNSESSAVVITGGGINATLSLATNGVENDNKQLVQVAVQFNVFNTRLESGLINGAEYYSFCGIETDDDGKVYLWLPQDIIDNELSITGVPAYIVIQ